jgi:hypothetical protein
MIAPLSLTTPPHEALVARFDPETLEEREPLQEKNIVIHKRFLGRDDNSQVPDAGVFHLRIIQGILFKLNNVRAEVEPSISRIPAAREGFAITSRVA